MIHLCTFTDKNMTESAERLQHSAYQHGVQNVHLHTFEMLDPLFMQFAAPAIHEAKGAGLYIWKPFVIWQTMNKLQDGDILIYADAGQTFISGVQSVVNYMDQGIMLFSNGWSHADWCKADVYEAIIPGADLRHRPQTQASLIFFRVSRETRDFVKEWMLWCLMPGFCDNSPSKLPNVPTFQETRWDQSILCCLQIKYGYRLHWFPTLTAMHIKDGYPDDNYPAIVDHHRKRNKGMGSGDSEW